MRAHTWSISKDRNTDLIIFDDEVSHLGECFGATDALVQRTNLISLCLGLRIYTGEQKQLDEHSFTVVRIKVRGDNVCVLSYLVGRS